MIFDTKLFWYKFIYTNLHKSIFLPSCYKLTTKKDNISWFLNFKHSRSSFRWTISSRATFTADIEEGRKDFTAEHPY